MLRRRIEKSFKNTRKPDRWHKELRSCLYLSVNEYLEEKKKKKDDKSKKKKIVIMVCWNQRRRSDTMCGKAQPTYNKKHLPKDESDADTQFSSTYIYISLKTLKTVPRIYQSSVTEIGPMVVLAQSCKSS